MQSLKSVRKTPLYLYNIIYIVLLKRVAVHGPSFSQNGSDNPHACCIGELWGTSEGLPGFQISFNILEPNHFLSHGFMPVLAYG